MALNRADLAVMAVLVAVGCGVSYALHRSLRRAVAQWQSATERQLSALAGKIRQLEATLAEQSQVPELQAVAAHEFEAPAPQANEVVQREDDEVTPEIRAVIHAAAAAFLGKKVRVLSAKLMELPHESQNAWSQQGRVFVQASHNLRSRG